MDHATLLALPKTRKDQDVTSRGGWSAASARGTVTLESVSSVLEESNDSRRQQIHVDEAELLNKGQNAEVGICGTAPTHIQSAETASFTSALDASSASVGTTESNRTTEVSSKGGKQISL